MAFIRIFTYFQYVNKGKDPHEELTGQRVYALIALVIIGDLFALVYVTVFYSCAGCFIFLPHDTLGWLPSFVFFMFAKKLPYF
jgi:hypothetical protein